MSIQTIEHNWSARASRARTCSFVIVRVRKAQKSLKPSTSTCKEDGCLAFASSWREIDTSSRLRVLFG
eukprot:726590-Pleurochrysis_carterae.AAC.1